MNKKDLIEIARTWLREMLAGTGLNTTELARAAGLNPSTLLRILNDPEHAFVPTLATVSRLVEAHGIPAPAALTGARTGGEAEGTPPARPTNGAKARKAEATPDRSLLDGYLPLVTTGALPEHLRHPDMPTQVPRPAALDGDATAFALRMPDAAMSPWVQTGALVYATRLQQPVANDIGVVELADGIHLVRLVTSIDDQGMALVASDGSARRVAFADIVSFGVAKVVHRL